MITYSHYHAFLMNDTTILVNLLNAGLFHAYTCIQIGEKTSLAQIFSLIIFLIFLFYSHSFFMGKGEEGLFRNIFLS